MRGRYLKMLTTFLLIVLCCCACDNLSEESFKEMTPQTPTRSYVDSNNEEEFAEEFMCFEIPEGLSEFLSTKRELPVVMYGMELPYDAADYITNYEFTTIEGNAVEDWFFSDAKYDKQHPHFTARFNRLSYTGKFIEGYVGTLDSLICYDNSGKYISKIGYLRPTLNTYGIADSEILLCGESADFEYCLINNKKVGDIYLIDKRNGDIKKIVNSDLDYYNTYGILIEKSERKTIAIFKRSEGGTQVDLFSLEDNVLLNSCAFEHTDELSVISMVNQSVYFTNEDSLYCFNLFTGEKKVFDIIHSFTGKFIEWKGNELNIEWKDISSDNLYAMGIIRTRNMERLGIVTLNLENGSIYLKDLSEHYFAEPYREYIAEPELSGKFICTLIDP